MPHITTAEPGRWVDVGEPGRRGAEAGPGAPEPAGPPIRHALDDRWLVATLIPGFGLIIPHATDLFGALGPGHATWWLGHLWFIGGAGLIYGANRTLLFAGRAHADWFSRPMARLVLLGVGVLFGTLPTTAIMLHGWAAFSGEPLGDALRVVTLVNVVCVVFVTWLYEMLFLIRERVDDQVRVERLAAARAEAELAAVRAQVDPHFLFNALNTLAGLVEARPREARGFVDRLARVYRALLDTRGRSLVPLEEEFEILAAYVGLLEVRFGDALRVRLPDAVAPGRRIPPMALQVLVENAVRHNALDPADPLVIDVAVSEDAVAVAHPVRPRSPRPGAGVGLANLDARAVATTGRPLTIERGPAFRVVVPTVPG